MKHFLLGIIFGELIFPLLGDFAALIQSAAEVFTTTFQKFSMKNGVEIAKMKKEIETIVGIKKDDENEITQVIGFTSEELEEEEEDE